MSNEALKSRRGVIAAAVGGAAALAAQSLVNPERTAADHAGFVKLDHYNFTDGTGFQHSTYTAVELGGPDNAVQTNTLAANRIGVKAFTQGLNSQVAIDADTRSNNGEGIAVRARTKNGIGVYAEGTGGYALQVVGRAVFNRSGRATVASGNASKTVSGFAITSATVVVATVQGNPAGVWVRNVSTNDAQDTFTIRLNKAAPSGGVVVGFFIVN